MLIYFYKIIASFLLPPGIIIIALFIAAFFVVKRRRYGAKFLGVIICVFYLLSISYIGEYLMYSLESRYNPPDQVSGDVIVVLGGGATLDTPDIEGVGNLSGSAANRLLTGVRLQRKLDVPIIISGGQVFEDTGREAIVAKRILMGLGVAEDKIIVEDTSLNTQQNAHNVKKILGERNFHEPLLVTSAFHMERSMLNFHKENVIITPFPADYMTSIRRVVHFNKFVPSAGGLELSCIALHEYLGIIAVHLI